MQAGPLRQSIAVFGLMALTPTMVLLAAGRIAPDVAAVRAVATFAIVIVLGRLVAMSLRFYLRTVERAQVAAVTEQRRRATDHAE